MTKHLKMNEEIIENETLKNEEEKETPETPEAEKPDKSKELQSALAQKDHFREKAEKAEKRVAEMEERLKSSVPAQKQETAPRDPVELVRLTKALSGFDEDETSFILNYAKEKTPEAIIKAANDDWVKTAIQAKREKVAKEKSVPTPSSPATKVSTEDLKKVISEGRVESDVARKVAELEAKKGRGGGI